ncbi:MAG: DUF2946 family protein [Methyloceanibacter sp.]
MAFYAVLVPWHTVSQATTGLLHSDLAKSFEPSCDHASAASGESSKSPQPVKPQTHCPICKGFAALHLALDAPANVLTVRGAAGTLLLPAAEDDLADTTPRAPRSRGPPLLSA